MSTHQARSSRVRVLLAFDGGGFLAEATSVMQALQAHVDLHLASPLRERDLTRWAIPVVPLHSFTRTTRIGERKWWLKAWRLFQGFRDARRLIVTLRPDAVVCLGSSIALPLFIVAHTSGATTVFIESMTRVLRPSTTGKLLSLLGICDRIYVQWPEAQGLYRNAIYKGRVF